MFFPPQVKGAQASLLTSVRVQITHQPKLQRMRLPPKVRHLVLINQTPLLLLLLPPPLSVLLIHFLRCLFLERNLRVPGINGKQTHSSHQKPKAFLRLRLSRNKKREKENTPDSSLWKNAYLNCGRIGLKALPGRGRCWGRCGGVKHGRGASPFVTLRPSLPSSHRQTVCATVCLYTKPELFEFPSLLKSCKHKHEHIS